LLSILDSLRVKPPEINVTEAAVIAQKHFGINGQAKFLGGERDSNFLIQSRTASVTLKIANQVENDQILELQSGALQHIEQHSPWVSTPRVVRTVDNEQWALFHSEDGQLLRSRVFTFIPGRQIMQGESDAGLLFNLGCDIAKLNLALRGYMHPSAQHRLGWDTQSLDQLANLVSYISDSEERQLINRVLVRFSKIVKPQLPGCRSQVIHNDISFHNVAVSLQDPAEIAGIFDFGDMIYGPLIQDVGNAAAEIPAGCSDQLSASAGIIAGFHSVLPLEEKELELLPDMMASRLAACLLLGAWSDSETSWVDERDHMDSWKQNCISMLKAILNEPEYGFENLIRSACGLAVKSQPVGFRQDQTDALWQQRQHYLGNANYFAYDKPIHMVRGQGVWLYGADGTKYLDAYNNVPNAGHCHPRITEAISRQTATLNTNTRYLYDVVSEYAEKISSTLPDGLDSCFFVSSGSEANDLAWRLATSWTGNAGGLVLNNAYHGITELTYALSPAESRGSKRTFPHMEYFAAPDDFRGQWKRDVADRGFRYAQYAEEAITRLAQRDFKPAALFLDMIMSSNGVIVPPPGYLEELFSIVRKAGGLCVADEVQSGFGRTGKHMWGFEFSDVTPDIVTFGKPIAGGYPMGLVVTRREIAQKFEQQGGFFSTTGGNPVACAAASAMLDVIKNESLMENAQAMGELLMGGLTHLAKQHTLIGDVRGSGLFIGVELVGDSESLRPAIHETDKLVNLLRDHGVLTGIDGAHNNVLKIRPPLVINERHVAIFLQTLEKVLALP
jgi:4-aminobutyrate aminotransferase-like enzyme/Ser/Thr protein kinase RdoA (MazF antagonist)